MSFRLLHAQERKAVQIISLIIIKCRPKGKLSAYITLPFFVMLYKNELNRELNSFDSLFGNDDGAGSPRGGGGGGKWSFHINPHPAVSNGCLKPFYLLPSASVNF
jgi:hypothetical protein